jgi:hypothetical protein
MSVADHETMNFVGREGDILAFKCTCGRVHEVSEEVLCS